MNAILMIPTRGVVWHRTAQWVALTAAQTDALPVFHEQRHGVSVARNEIVKEFLNDYPDSDILVMLDDDVEPNPDPNVWMQILEAVDSGAVDICGACVPIKRQGEMFYPAVFKHEGDRKYTFALDLLGQEGLQLVDGVGTGFIAIHRRVLEHHNLRPAFDALRAKDGTLVLGEDINFCRRATSQGFRIGAHYDVWCEHRVEMFANEVAQVYMTAMSGLIESQLSEAQLQEADADPDPVPVDVEVAEVVEGEE